MIHPAQDTGKCLSVKIGHEGYREDVGEPGVGWTLSERRRPVRRGATRDD